MWRMLLLLVFGLAAPAAAQQRIDPGSWFDPLDLPRDMLARVGTGGKLVMAIDVGPDGRPLRCAIAATSGLADLVT